MVKVGARESSPGSVGVWFGGLIAALPITRKVWRQLGERRRQLCFDSNGDDSE